ncbi:MAG: element excision factor XisH family protein [Caldilineaceae bacterium]
MANDLIHDAVKHALIKDGWSIEKEHFKIEYEEIEVYADLLARRGPIVAEKDQRTIIIEVKTFAGRSFIRELQQALGQYDLYLDLIELTSLNYELYLAVSDSIYEQFFLRTATRQIIARRHLRLLVVNVEQEEIVSWIQ